MLPRPVLSLVCLALIATSVADIAAAQRLVVAVHDDDSFNSGSAIGWPSGTVAMRFQPTTTFLAAAAEVFTGNGLGTNRLAIRSHDVLTDAPGATLVPAASWSMVAARCWQGVAFPTPVQLNANATYWLVWDVVNFAQNSVAGTSVTPDVDVRVSADGGASWHAQVTWAAKLRIYEPAAAGTLTPFGAGKPGVNGVPTIGVTGWPVVGNPLDVWLDGTERRAPCLLLVGLPTTIPTPLGTVYVDPGALLLMTTTFGSTPNFRGTLTHTFRVPVVPGAAGFPLTFQWAVFDAAAVGGIAHTAAVTALLQ